MKRLVLILSLIPTLALAQEQSKFVPYTINQEDHSKLMTYLGDQPAKFSMPLIQALNALEQKAIDDNKKKQDEKDKK